MKKYVRLIIPLGLLTILFTLIWGNALARGETNSFKPANKDAGGDQIGPPWFDSAWSYRRPVVVSNSGATLPYYQVLVKLDINNFDFSRTKVNGGDIRFTHSDGTTELKYWIESWDSSSQLAYVWVRVPSLANGETTIYLYYGNPDATSASDGNPTFDGFEDDWSDFSDEGSSQDGNIHITPSSGGINSPLEWDILAGTPEASAGELSLNNATGIKSTSSIQYTAAGFRANYGSGGGNEWGGFINGASGQRATIGDIPADPSNLYLNDYRTGLVSILLPRVGGNDWHNAYHIYEVRWSSAASVGDIDHGDTTATELTQVPNSALPVTLYNNNSGANTILKIDWVYVRQYRDPEPTTSVQTEQRLVELSISNTDSPDPVRPDVRLTYLLTITNTRSIDAQDLIITDTLPVSVEIAEIDSSQGSCDRGSIVYCYIPSLDANTEAWVTIVVTPSVGGVITNTAIVGSTGYELDLSNNYSEQTTLIDSKPPVVNWESPVGTGGTYYTFGGIVTLEASAADEGGIAWVEFRYWDHISEPHQWRSIGSDTTYPYRVPFDSSILAVTPQSSPYQVVVIAVDQAGNQSDYTNPPQVIYLLRKLGVFLPLVRR